MYQLINKHLQKASSGEVPKELVLGALSALVINAFGIFVNFGLQILLARILGVASYGIYILVLSWTNILVLFATLGFDTLLLRYVGVYFSNQKLGLLRGLFMQTSKLASLFGLGLGLIMTLVVLQCEAFISSELAKTFYIAAVLIPVWSLTNLRVAALRALKKIISARLPEFILRPGLVGIVLLVCHYLTDFNLNAPTTLYIHILSSLIVFLLTSYLLYRALPKKLFQLQPKFSTQQWVNVAVSLMFLSGMYIILSQVDLIMVGLMRDSEQVGIYSVAVKITGMILFGTHAISAIAIPMISEYHETKSKQELQSLVTQVANSCLLLGLPIMLLLLVLGPEILAWFGSEFKIAYFCLIVLSIGQLWELAIGPAAALLTMTGHERSVLKILALSLICNIGLNIPLIYFYGINGAALATALSVVLKTLLTCYQAKKLTEVESWCKIACN